MTECIHEMPTEQCTICSPRKVQLKTRHERPVKIPARYGGPCPRCGLEIYPGEYIYLIKGALIGASEEWICQSCGR